MGKPQKHGGLIQNYMEHQPVLKKEILEILDPKPGQKYIDCTFGFGGHAFSILEKIVPSGRILAFEADQEVYEKQKAQLISFRYAENISLVNSNFNYLKQVVEDYNFYPVNGILIDLGISSWQIEESGRGFSFNKDEPLLMNYAFGELSARDILNEWPESEILEILKKYGQERYAHRITRAIIQQRKLKSIQTTRELVEIIRWSVPKNYLHQKIHFATRTFLALRIVVNKELESLEKILPQAVEILELEGKIAVISFNSLEDRIVKNFFRELARQNRLQILNKKPIRSTGEEVQFNPRSRSARLRSAVKIKEGL